MAEVWAGLAEQIPFAVAIILLVLLLRKSEVEERHASIENWQAFLTQRDSQWQGFLTGAQKANDVVIATMVGQMEAVGKQMEAVSVNLQDVRTSIDHFGTVQEYMCAEMREFLKRHDTEETKKE